MIQSVTWPLFYRKVSIIVKTITFPWMTEKCLDEYFSVPFHIVRRKISGIRDSLASSVWRPHFKGALQKYPEFKINLLDFSVPICDACHMGGRISTFVGRTGGSPYDKLTFEVRFVNLLIIRYFHYFYSLLTKKVQQSLEILARIAKEKEIRTMQYR